MGAGPVAVVGVDHTQPRLIQVVRLAHRINSEQTEYLGRPVNLVVLQVPFPAPDANALRSQTQGVCFRTAFVFAVSVGDVPQQQAGETWTN